MHWFASDATRVGQHHEWRQGVSRRWISRDELLPPNREELGPKALNGGCRMFGNASIVAQAWHFEAWRASCLVPLFFFGHRAFRIAQQSNFICPEIQLAHTETKDWDLAASAAYFPHPMIRLEGAVFGCFYRQALCNTAWTVRILKQAGSRNLSGIQLTFGPPLYWHFLKSLCWYQLWKMKKGHLGFSRDRSCWCPKTQKKR